MLNLSFFVTNAGQARLNRRCWFARWCSVSDLPPGPGKTEGCSYEWSKKSPALSARRSALLPLCTALPTQHGACTESVSENTWQQITRWFCHPGDHGVFFVWSFLTHNINFGCCLFEKRQRTELEHKKVKKIFIQAPWQYPVIKSTIVNETTKSQTCSTLHNWELESQRDC